MKKQQSGLTNQVTFLLALTCGSWSPICIIFNQLAPKLLRPFKSVLVLLVLLLCYPIRLCARLTFLVPLGDVVDRRKLIIRVAALSSLSLSAAFFTKFSPVCSLLFYRAALYCRPNYSLCCGHGGTSEPW